MVRLSKCAAALTLSLLAVASAWAQSDADSNPVKLVVPFDPGGGVDITARAIAQALTGEMKKQVVVLNRAGAGTVIGTQAVASSAPDGQNLLYAGIGLAFQPGIFKKLPYDPKRDLVQVATTGRQPYILAVGPSVPAKNLAELVALARQKPGGLTFGTPGVGSAPHIAAEVLWSALGVKVTHVPYKGGAPAVVDLIGGRIDMVVGTVTLLTPRIKAGEVRGIGVTSVARTTQLPALPTIAEQGHPDFQFYTWSGLFARAGTPEPVQARINEALARALAQPAVKETLERDGFQPLIMSPRDAQRFYLSELERWPAVMRQVGIQPE